MYDGLETIEKKEDKVVLAIEEILQNKGIELNKFVEMGKIPLGTKSKPYWEYNGNIPEDEIVFFKMPKVYEPQPIMLLGIAGSGKTFLMKRFAYYYKYKNNHLFIFEPKDDEWIRARRFPKNIGLAPGEKPSKLDIVGLAPSYIFNKHLEYNIKDYTNISLDLTEFAEQDLRDFWLELGLSDAGTDWVRKNISSDKNTISKLISTVRKSDAVHSTTKKNIDSVLSTLKFDNIFSEKMNKRFVDEEVTINFTKLNARMIKKLWKEKKSIVLSFFYPDKRYLPAYFFYLMRCFYYLTMEYSIKKNKQILKKAIFVDDCNLFIPNMGRKKNPSAEIAITSLTLWRKYGFNMFFATQHPDLTDPMLISNCKHFLVYNIGKVERIEPYINNPEITKIIKKLKYNPNEHLTQCCHIYQNSMKYQTFYPFLSNLGHFVKNKENEEDVSEEEDY